MLKNEILIKRVKEYQNLGVAHPLTCGYNSLHNELIAIEKDNKLILKCVDCDYIQENIPDMFFHEKFDNFLNESKKTQEWLYNNKKDNI